jgi:hypothetical protein
MYVSAKTRWEFCRGLTTSSARNCSMAEYVFPQPAAPSNADMLMAEK